MEPLPHTRQALEEISRYVETNLVDDLVEMGERARGVVPECIGYSLSLLPHGLTFTLVTPGAQRQHPAGRPAAAPSREAGGTPRPDEPGDPLDEDQWCAAARAGAAAGVGSSLSLPIHHDRHVVGEVDLYASAPDAFTDRRQAVADVFGAWAPGAVSNADLPFRSRHEAANAPDTLDEGARLDRAVGVIAESRNLDPVSARDVLRQASRRAGLSETAIADSVLGSLNP